MNDFDIIPVSPVNTGPLNFRKAAFGLAYYTYADVEDDNVKEFHYVRFDGSGEWFEITYSPYRLLTSEHLADIANIVSQVEEYELYDSCGCEFDF
jgi:hypothetical protein